MNRLLIALLSLISFSIADVHSGLRNTIDKGDIKTAENLVKKVGVKDIYCPANLSYENALQIYGNVFAEFPEKMWEFCNSDFIKKAESSICKTNVPLCRELFKHKKFETWKTHLKQIKESKLHEQKEKNIIVNPFAYEISQYEQWLSDELKNPSSNIDYSLIALVKSLKKNKKIDSYTRNITMNKFLKDIDENYAYNFKYSRYLSDKDVCKIKRMLVVGCNAFPNIEQVLNDPENIGLYIFLNTFVLENGEKAFNCDSLVQSSFELLTLSNNKKNIIEFVLNAYAQTGTVSDSLKAFACRAYPKIDKDVNKKAEINVFNCD